MKVIYFLGSLNRTAPNTVILNIILNNNFDNIKIISLNKSKNDNYKSYLEEKGIEYYEYSSFKYAFFDILKIKKEIKQIDIIHLNTYHPNVFGFLLRRFGSNTKMIATCHAVEDQEAVSSNKGLIDKLKSYIRLNIHKYLYKRQDKTVAVSKEVKKYLKTIDCIKASTIYNGVNYESFPIFKLKDKNRLELNFCQVGNIINRKNQMYSIRMIKFLRDKGKNVKLHIFGDFSIDKDYYTLLQKYMVNNNLEEEIIFYGNLQFAQLFKNLQNMDIQLMPSFSEGLPLGLIEAFYFQLPAIVSQNGGMKEVVIDNLNGLVVDILLDNDFEKIYQYVNNKIYISNGIEARKLALKKFSAKNMASEYMKEYKKLLS